MHDLSGIPVSPRDDPHGEQADRTESCAARRTGLLRSACSSSGTAGSRPLPRRTMFTWRLPRGRTCKWCRRFWRTVPVSIAAAHPGEHAPAPGTQSLNLKMYSKRSAAHQSES